MLLVKPGFAFAGDHHRGLQAAVQVHGPVNLRHDLTFEGFVSLLQIPHGFRQGHGRAPLIHHAVKLFLEFQEHRGRICRRAVAAETELFLIVHCLDGIPDKTVIRCVQIQAQHGAPAVCVRHQMETDPAQQRVVLFFGKQVFLFYSFEDTGRIHMTPPSFALCLS